MQDSETAWDISLQIQHHLHCKTLLGWADCGFHPRRCAGSWVCWPAVFHFHTKLARWLILLISRGLHNANELPLPPALPLCAFPREWGHSPGCDPGSSLWDPCFQSGAHPQLQLNVGALSPLLLFCPDAFGPCSIHPNRLILIFVKLSEDCRLQHYLGRVFNTITKKRKPGWAS